MNIVGIIGSPHGDKGSTGALLRIVLEGARESGASSSTFIIKGQEVKPCLGCDTCHKKGICPQKDAFPEIKEKIMAADGLIVATPNYISHVSAQLKAFFDRCCGVVHCQGFSGKYGASVVTSGGGDEGPIVEYMNQFLAVTGVIPVGAVWATMGRIQGEEFPEEIRKQAFDLGKRLVAAWKGKQASSEYSAVTERFAERMRSLIQWRKEEWPYEYEFWKEQRGLL